MGQGQMSTKKKRHDSECQQKMNGSQTTKSNSSKSQKSSVSKVQRTNEEAAQQNLNKKDINQVYNSEIPAQFNSGDDSLRRGGRPKRTAAALAETVMEEYIESLDYENGIYDQALFQEVIDQSKPKPATKRGRKRKPKIQQLNTDYFTTNQPQITDNFQDQQQQSQEIPEIPPDVSPVLINGLLDQQENFVEKPAKSRKKQKGLDKEKGKNSVVDLQSKVAATPLPLFPNGTYQYTQNGSINEQSSLLTGGLQYSWSGLPPSKESKFTTSVYGIPDFPLLNVTAEICAEIKTLLPRDQPISINNMLGFLIGKVIYHSDSGFTAEIGKEKKLRCGCQKCRSQKEFNFSNFESHCGCKLQEFRILVTKDPNGIRLSDMMSIINTDLIDTHIGHCQVCKIDGDLICCDGCPLSFHAVCVGLKKSPKGDWYCPKCVTCNRKGKKRIITNRLMQQNNNVVNNNNNNNNNQIGTKQENFAPENKSDSITISDPTQFLEDGLQVAESLRRNKRKPARNFDSDYADISKILKSNNTMRRYRYSTTYSYSSKLRNQRLFTLEAGLLEEGQEVCYRILGQNILRGWVVLSPEDVPGPKGVRCSCCNEIVTMSMFERHAGYGKRRAPYDCTYIKSGTSLKELAMKLPQDDLDEDQRERINNFQIKYQYNPDQRAKRRRLCVGRTAGRTAPPGQVHQIDDRTRLIVDRFKGYLPVLDLVPGGCQFCKLEEFAAEFSDKTMIICDQCEREYHVGCLRENQICDLDELPVGEWFCCEKCEEIRNILKEKVGQGEFIIEDGENNANKNKNMVKSARIMRGQRDHGSHHQSLQGALELIRESFDPIKDGVSGIDLLPKMVMSEVSDDGIWDFTGMCTVILKRASKIVAASTFRVFGTYLAELPLVAVKLGERGKGYCKDIVQLLENIFRDLGVEKMMLPAAAPTLRMWRTKFGCTPMGHTHASNVRAYAKYMCFPDCTFVYKNLSENAAVEKFEDEDIEDILAMSEEKLAEAIKELNQREAEQQQKTEKTEENFTNPKEKIQQQEQQQKQPKEKQKKQQGGKPRKKRRSKSQKQISQQKSSLKKKISVDTNNKNSTNNNNINSDDDDDITISEIDINSLVSGFSGGSTQLKSDFKESGEISSLIKETSYLSVSVQQVDQIPKHLEVSKKCDFRTITVKIGDVEIGT